MGTALEKQHEISSRLALCSRTLVSIAFVWHMKPTTALQSKTRQSHQGYKLRQWWWLRGTALVGVWSAYSVLEGVSSFVGSSLALILEMPCICRPWVSFRASTKTRTSGPGTVHQLPVVVGAQRAVASAVDHSAKASEIGSQPESQHGPVKPGHKSHI